jgi:hypothetical protein
MLQSLKAYDAHNPLALDDIVARFPTLSKAEAAPGLSAKYKPISTLDTLRQLTGAGFQVHGVQVSRIRSPEKRGFEKHAIRLRAPGSHGARVGDYFPEAVLSNAHDGTGAWDLVAGMMRLVCLNGMAVGTAWGSIRVAHVGNVSARVLAATHDIADNFGKLHDVIDAMRAKVISYDAAYAFAEEAHKLRFPEGNAPVLASTLLDARRVEDAGQDLWTVYNRVQENVVRGGQQGAIVTSRGPRMARTRGVNAIDASMKLNRRLFDLAEKYLQAA